MPAIDEPNNLTFSGAGRRVSGRGIAPARRRTSRPTMITELLRGYSAPNFRDQRLPRSKRWARATGRADGVRPRGIVHHFRPHCGRTAREFAARTNPARKWLPAPEHAHCVALHAAARFWRTGYSELERSTAAKGFSAVPRIGMAMRGGTIRSG